MDDKPDFHIRRFERAIEQCEDKPAKLDELKANLEYWKKVKVALAAKPEDN